MVPRTVVIVVRLALGVALLAVGCGSDAVSDGDPTATTAPTSTASADIDGDVTEPDPDPDLSDDPSSPLVDLEWTDEGTNAHVLVDTRNATAYGNGHIEGAVNLPADALNDPTSPVQYQLGSAERVADALGELGIAPQTTVVLYDGESSLSAARVYFALHYYHHDDIRILDGGITVWELDGRPTSMVTPLVEAVDYQPGEATPELRLVLGDVTDRIESADTVFADARSAGEYAGETIFGAERGGHIPGARNLDYADTVGPDGRFLDVVTLDEIHVAAGLGPDVDVVTYCLVGARGAHSWFVMSELLGYPSVALYDGSWVEYGTTDGLEVET